MRLKDYGGLHGVMLWTWVAVVSALSRLKPWQVA